MHPLFAEFARFQLEALDPGARVTLQRKAAAVLGALGSCPTSPHITPRQPGIMNSSPAC